MERYSSRTIDELGRLVLHRDLRQRLDIKPGSMVYLKVIDNIVILQCKDSPDEFDSGACEVCELGRITIPTKIRDVLGWKEKDKIASYHTGEVVILRSLAEKQDIIITKNNRPIAKLTNVQEDKISILDSLIGIIPNNGFALEDAKDERLARK